MKKIISLFLASTIIITMMCAFTTQPVMAASRVSSTTEWNDFDSTNNYLKATSDTYGKFQISSSDSDGTVTYYENGMSGVTDEPFVNVKSNKFINVSSYDPFVNNEATFSYSFYVPDSSKGQKREHIFTLKDVNANVTMQTKFVARANGGKVSAYCNGTNWTTSKDSSSTDITYDKWHTVDLSMAIANGTFTMEMYYDDMLLWTGTRTLTEDSNGDVSFKINQMYFNNNVDTPTSYQDTYMKDIKLTYNPCFTDVDFTSGVSSSGNKIYAKDYGFCSTASGTKQLQTASASDDYYEGKNTVSHNWSNKDLKVTLTPSTEAKAMYAMVQNIRGDLPTISAGTTKYAELSYDIKIQEGTESTERQQAWSLHNVSGSNSSSLWVESYVVDGYVHFRTDEGKDFAGKVLTEKTSKLKFESEKWYTISLILTASADSSGNLNVKYEGYVKDISAGTQTKIYEREATWSGTVLRISQNMIYITTPKSDDGTTCTTTYDNICTLMGDSNVYSNAVDKNANKGYGLDLTYADNKATLYGRSNDTNYQLIIAGFDAKGYIKSIKMGGTADTSKELSNVKIIELPFVDGIKTFKAFMMETGSFKPLTENAIKTITE